MDINVLLNFYCSICKEIYLANHSKSRVFTYLIYYFEIMDTENNSNIIITMLTNWQFFYSNNKEL